MKDIVIKFIRHDNQRYETLGDYWEDNESIQFRITKFEDWRVEFLLALHELIEKALNIYNKISDKQVDDWDFNCKEDDPGSNPKAPYYNQHLLALSFETIMAKLIGLDFASYDEILDKVEDKEK